MRSKIITILLLLGICISGMGQTLQTAQKMDSVKVDSLNQAASNPDFIQAYLLVISEGKAFLSDRSSRKSKLRQAMSRTRGW